MTVYKNVFRLACGDVGAAIPGMVILRGCQTVHIDINLFGARVFVRSKSLHGSIASQTSHLQHASMSGDS